METKSNGEQKGAAMVEMAIVLPALIILLFAIIQMGIALNRVQAYHAAAREGARIGSLESGSSAEIQSAVTAALNGINGPAPALSISPGPCLGRPGQQITVAVSSPYVVQIPLLPDLPITLTGDAVFRCEG